MELNKVHPVNVKEMLIEMAVTTGENVRERNDVRPEGLCLEKETVQ